MVLLTASESNGPFKFKSKLAWSVSVGVLCLTCAGALLVIDPVLLITSYSMQVTNGSEVHKFLMKSSECIHLSMFLFNITNPKSFLSGEDHKLKVEEVGPFTYREDRVNEELEVDEEAGLIRYRPRIDVSFLPEKSVAHPDNVTLTLPNLALLGLATMFSTFPFWMQSSLEVLTTAAASKPLVTLDAGSYLWGYHDPIISLANKLAPNMIGFDKLGLLDRLYDKQTPNYLEVSARNEDKFSIRIRNGHKKLAMGKMANPDECDDCDDFTNVYEGLGYPSPTTPETPIKLFRNGLCRTLPVDFHKRVVLASGVHGLLYNLSDSFYTQGQNGTNRFMLDLRRCFYGIPLALSKLYFEDVDPALYDRVEGVPPPDPDRGSYLIIEPMVAMELETVVRVQLNLVLGDVGFNSKTKRFTNMIIPIGYVEIIQPPLPEETQRILQLMYVTSPLLVLLTQVALFLSGASLTFYPLLACLRRRGITKPPPPVRDTQQPLLIDKSDTVIT